MKKKIFFPVVLVATILLGGIITYTLWSASSKTAQAYFDSGKKYFDENKYPEATIQFMNALRKDSRHRNARYFLALSYVNQQDLYHGVTHLRSLLELHPDDIEANLELGTLYLSAAGKDPELLREAEAMASTVLAKDPSNVAGLVLSGNVAAGLQDYQTAMDFYEKAIELDPRNLFSLVGIGTVQTFLKNFSEAERAFLKAREIQPRNKNVLVSLANYYLSTRQPAKVEAVYTDALSIFPTDKQIYLQLVAFYNQTGQFDKAVNVLRDVQSRNPADPQPSLLLVELYRSNGRPADSRQLILELKEKYPKNVAVAISAAQSFLQDQPERARAEIDLIRKSDPKNPLGYLLEGQLQFISGQYDAAKITLEKPEIVDSPHPEVHFLLGNIAALRGQADQAISHYQKALVVASAYVPARVGLAEALLSQDKVEDARAEVQKALSLQPSYLPARLLKASVDGRDKNNKDAEQELTNLAKEQPENPLVFRQMGLYYDSRGKTADAEKNFVRALELQPNSNEILRDLTLFYVRQKQPDRAIQKIDAIPDDKKQAYHYELLGLVNSQAGRMQAAETAFKKAKERDPVSTRADKFLFEDYIRTGRTDDSLQKLDDIIKKNPSEADAYQVKAQVYERQGKLDEARKYYEQALKLNANSPVAANNLAFLLAEKGTDKGTDLITALDLMKDVRKKYPENPDFADTMGWVYYKLGDFLLAREQARFAVSKDPNNGSYQYHLGIIYKRLRQNAEAQAALKKAATSPRDFKEKSLTMTALKDLATPKY